MGCVVIYEGKRQGPDIVAHCKGPLLVIEARAVPLMFKVIGRGRGKPKSINMVRAVLGLASRGDNRAYGT
jgi:hypothetical protein